MTTAITPNATRTTPPEVAPSVGAPSTNATAQQLFTTPNRNEQPETAKGYGLAAAVAAMGNDTNNINTMLGELEMQTNIFKEADKNTRDRLVRKWYKKVLGTASLLPMVGVTNGHLRVVFGIAEYQAGFGEECIYDEEVVGFMGDRTASKSPMLIKLSKRVGWRIVKKAFTGESTLRTFYADAGNAKKFYVVNNNDSTSELLLPTLLQVPRGHVKWLVEKPRSAWEYHEKLINDLGGEQPDQRPAVLAPFLAFLQWASSAKASSDITSAGEMALEPIFTEDFQALQKWTEGRLNTILGPMPQPNTTPTITNVYQQPPPGQSPFEEGGNSNDNNTTGGQGGKKSDKSLLSVLQKAQLKGYCHAIYDHELPLVWSKLETTSNVEDMRRYIDDAWEASRKQLGIDVGECNVYYLEDATVNDWKDCKFALGGAVLVWDFLMKGMSILLMSMFSAQAKLNSQEQQRIYDDTRNTRTEEQAARRNKKEPRQPPQSWHTMKYLINTYGIMIHALFSHMCPHFKTVWALREVLVTMRERTSYFNAQVCKLLTAHTLRDSKRFFSVRLMPEDFDGITAHHQVNWPQSYLADVAKHVFNFQFAALEIADMPYKWRETSTPTDNKRQADEQGSRETGGPSGWRQQGRNADIAGQYSGGGQSGGQGGVSRDGSQHDVAPAKIRDKLGALVDECKGLCRNFGFRELRDLGGLDPRNIPYLRKYADNRSGMPRQCNGGLLGICHFGDGRCNFQRVDPRDVTEPFAQAFADTVGPCLEQCVRKLRENNSRENAGRGGAGRGRGDRPGPRAF
jgi:uncharacterized membrane protein YgcG